jgi:hypothetical protein
MAGCASGYMLEYLEDPVVLNMSDNPTGADNQQERLSDHTQNPQRPYARDPVPQPDDDMVRAAWRHAEVSGTETTHPSGERM